MILVGESGQSAESTSLKSMFILKNKTGRDKSENYFGDKMIAFTNKDRAFRPIAVGNKLEIFV